MRSNDIKSIKFAPKISELEDKIQILFTDQKCPFSAVKKGLRPKRPAWAPCYCLTVHILLLDLR